MIYELKKSDYYKCKDLANRGGNIEEKAIINGTNPGRVFVNNIVTPRSALIWQGNLDGFIFIGDSRNKVFNEEIKEYIDQEIIPQAKKLGLEWFECIGNHESWYVTFEEIFADRELKSWNQQVYTLPTYEYKQINTPDSQVIRITEENIANSKIENIQFVESKILEFWENTEKFFTEGIGFGIIQENKVVSLCISGYRYKNILGIDVETLGAYRGNKFAQKAVHAFLQQCFANGLIPYWDCMESNLPSNALAKSVGFTIEFRYKGYEFQL
jgi:RimJ/RimL family protein N-acetyltransferase